MTQKVPKKAKMITPLSYRFNYNLIITIYSTSRDGSAKVKDFCLSMRLIIQKFGTLLNIIRQCTSMQVSADLPLHF